MKRRIPRAMWLGLLLVLAAPVLYGTVFIRFAATRDIPWAPLLMIAGGLTLLVHGMLHARREPATYRGKVLAPAVLAAAVLIGGVFTFAIVVAARMVPASANAPHAGQPAPEFTLPDQDGQPVSLAELTATRGKGALLVFYRGYW